MQIKAGETPKSSKIGRGVYTTVGTIRGSGWFWRSYWGVRKTPGGEFDEWDFEDELLVLNFSPQIVSSSALDFSPRQECLWIPLKPSHVAPHFSPPPLSSPPLHSPIPPSSLSLSLSRRFELDNENNEFGVCFSLCVCRALPQLLSLHLARPLSLSFSPLALTPCHTLFPMPEPPYTHTHTHSDFFFLNFFSMYVTCFVLQFVLPTLRYQSVSSSRSPLCPCTLFSISYPPFPSLCLSLCLSMWFHAPAALLSVCLRLC